MTEQETADVKAIQEQEHQIMKTAFSGMRNALRMKEETLKCTGHKTRESAIVGHYQYAQKQIDELWKGYFKKYPD